MDNNEKSKIFVFIALESVKKSKIKILYKIINNRQSCLYSFKNQFVCPNPKGYELIFCTPFRGGANAENQCNNNLISKFKQPLNILGA